MFMTAAITNAIARPVWPPNAPPMSINKPVKPPRRSAVFYNDEVTSRVRTMSVVLLLGAGLSVGLSAQQTQTAPVPKPFPGAPAPSAPPSTGPAAPAPQTPIVRPALPTAQSGAPTDEMLGVPGIIYPTSDFLESIDIGRGQRCYFFGTN